MLPTTPARPRPGRRWGPVAALAVAGALVAAGCGADEPAANDGAPAPTTEAGPTVPDDEFQDVTGQDRVVVQARDNAFVGPYLTVSAGTDVVFENRGRNPHNAIPVADGAFAEVPTDALQPGDEATVTFDEPGDYPYYCTLHGTTTAGMTGLIRVEG